MSSSSWATATPAPSSPENDTKYWELEDPAGQGIDAVRTIREDIKARIELLLSELLPSENPA